MVFIILLAVEFLLLFFLSRVLTKELSIVFLKITKSKKITVYLLSLLFLPGTILHEMSHFFSAILLFVKTGEIGLFPQVEEDHVKLGKVAIYETDFIRRFIIGVAPFIIGNIVIFSMLSFFIDNNFLSNPLLIFLLIYALFAIGNTMFSSKQDLKGILELFIFLIVIFVFLYILGLRLSQINFNFLEQNSIKKITKEASIFISFPVLIDFFLIFVFRLFNKKSSFRDYS